MSEKRVDMNARTSVALEYPQAGGHGPAAVAAFVWGRQEQRTRQPAPLPRMPNGDPPTLILWGAEDV